MRDIPRAVALSLALTLLTVLVTLPARGLARPRRCSSRSSSGARARRSSSTLADVKINFLNFAALPITFGIGVDYAVNVVQGTQADAEDILGALRTTGGRSSSAASRRCWDTWRSSARRTRDSEPRTIAVVGEVSCLLAAMTVSQRCGCSSSGRAGIGSLAAGGSAPTEDVA